MRRILFILFLLIFTMSVGCSKVKGKDTQSIEAPVNEKLSIKGTWKVKSVTPLDKESDNEDMLNSLRSSTISISTKVFSILDKKYMNPNYKLKVVDKDYKPSNQDRFKLNDLLNMKSSLDDICIVSHNNLIGEFLNISDKESYFIYYGFFIELTKINDETIDSNNDLMNSKDKSKPTDVGLMIGLKTPRKPLENGSYTEEKYRTLWIPFKDNKLGTIVQKDNIIFPRMNGIWEIIKNTSIKNGRYNELFKLIKVEDENSEIGQSQYAPYDYRTIDFVSNNYIAIGGYNGSSFKNQYDENKLLPVNDMNSLEGIDIRTIYGTSVEERYLKDFNTTLGALSSEKLKNLIKSVSYRDFTLKRINGKWNLIGNIRSSTYHDPGISYTMTLKPNKVLVNYDNLLLPWDTLSEKFPFIKDACISPNENLAVLLVGNELLVYNIKNKDISGSPLMTVKLNDDEQVVMDEWATDSYVDTWSKAFKDGVEIK